VRWLRVAKMVGDLMQHDQFTQRPPVVTGSRPVVTQTCHGQASTAPFR
jgi:hypothetical protein